MDLGLSMSPDMRSRMSIPSTADTRAKFSLVIRPVENQLETAPGVTSHLSAIDLVVISRSFMAVLILLPICIGKFSRIGVK